MAPLATNGRLCAVSALYLVATIVSLSLLLTFSRAVTDDLKRLADEDRPPKPCGIAVPNIGDLVYGLGMKIWPWNGLPDSGSNLVQEVEGALCLEATPSRAVQALYLDHFTNTTWTEDTVAAAVCSESAFDGVRLRELEGPMFIDPLTRVTRAYIRAHTAFYQYSTNVNASCDWPTRNPFSSKGASVECTYGAVVLAELAAAAQMDVVTGVTVDASGNSPLPTVTEMVYRLLALAVLSYRDRDANAGMCFKNRVSADASTLCRTVYSAAISAGIGTQASTSTGPFGFQHFYADANHDVCIEDPVRSPPPSPPPRGAVQYSVYEGGLLEPYFGYVRQCTRMHEYGIYDVDALYGLPDFERLGSVSLKNEGGLLGFATSSWFNGYVEAWFLDKRKLEGLASPQREAMLFAAYRVGATLMWLTPALNCIGYWLARGGLPFVVILLPKIRNLFSSAANQTKPRILEKPSSSWIQLLAVISTFCTSVFMISVDPRLLPLYQRPECEDYKFEGTVYGNNRYMRTIGYASAVLVLFVALYALAWECFLRKRKDGRAQLPRPSGFISLIALGGVLFVIIFDTLLIVDSVDEFVDQAGKYENNRNALVRSAEQIERDVVVLAMTMVFLSFSIGVLTTRWAFIKGTRRDKILWLLLGLVPCGLAYFVRWQVTFDELRLAAEDSGYSARNAAHVCVAVVCGVNAAVFAYFWQESNNIAPAPVRKTQAAKVAEAKQAPPPLVRQNAGPVVGRPRQPFYRRFFNRGTRAALTDGMDGVVQFECAPLLETLPPILVKP